MALLLTVRVVHSQRTMTDHVEHRKAGQDLGKSSEFHGGHCEAKQA